MKNIETDTKVVVKCPTYMRGRKLTGTITGKKHLAPLHIAEFGETYYVKIDGKTKSTALHESWITPIN